MSSPRKRILSLNLGSQSIELAEFRALPDGGLALLGYHTRELFVDPADGMQYAAIAAALREMLDALQIKNGEVNYAIAENLVFTRFVKLPSIDAEKIERIIAFEAQQNVPYPIDEVVWDYQVVGVGTGEQVEVVFVAIKGDLLEEINAVVESAGLRTSIVDVATMALGNAFRYNYADLSGCSLLVDIGARTTNLLFIESAKIFCRSVAIGGSSITSVIAKEFNEPFAAAEFRKKRDGFATILGAGLGPDDVMRVSQIVRGTMTRLHAEVMRSISHYRVQQQGSAPERVFLSGGCAKTTCLREFFDEKLQLPTELFDPLRNVAVADFPSLGEITRSKHLLGEPVGLALRAATDCPMKLNLRPASVVRRQELERRRPFFIMAAAAAVLALFGWGFFYTRAAQVARSGAEKIGKINEPMHAAEAKIDKLRKQAATLDAAGVPLTAAISDRFFWIEILEDLNARLPKEDIWITELMPMSGGKPIGVDEKHAAEIAPTPAVPRSTTKGQAAGAAIDGVLLRGLYLFNPKQQEVVVDYFRNLVGSPFFNVDPNNQARAIKSTIPNNTDWAFPYELRLDLKKPVRLP
jgi:type IV pilus assembly protein PilM